MEAEAAKYIGAGLATLGMIGSAIGVGNIFANFLNGALRNPSAAASQVGNLFVGAALSLSMVVALTSLEVLVAGLQAFVFTVLTCIYLNDVVNLGHGH